MRAASDLPRVSRLRRRGAFGLDERRWPDPARVEAQVRVWLRHSFPEIWVLPDRDETDASGRSLVLLLPRGQVAMLRIERRRDTPGKVAIDLLDRCKIMRLPVALVSSLDEARAALRRFGVAGSTPLSSPDLLRRS